MPANYVLLEKITVGAAGASSVTFSSIPQTGYTDLVLKASTRDDRNDTGNHILVSFNGSTSSFSSIGLYGSGSTAASFNSIARTTGTINSLGNTSNTFSNNEIYIPNYTGSFNKSYSADSVRETNAADQNQIQLTAGLWSNTAAITSITLTPNVTANIIANSTFYLYGVAKLNTTPAIAPKASGGDIIDTDGTYWYHTFLSSGTFTPSIALSCDYLVVAGGGGGGANGGGGGAGGLRCTVGATGGGGSLESALSLASGTGYTVTIGAGGAAGTSSAKGVNGSNSVFSTITSTGGGGGGTDFAGLQVGNTGGSGGGTHWDSASAGGSGTANQGYAGGARQASPERSGGGGGAGEAGNTDAQSDGGDGIQTSISGTSTYYGGGGGGAKNETAANSVGGLGGGGNGGAAPTGTVSQGTAGTANTGGGGGAGRTSGVGNNGGSGIVIVRYAV
jgi:hypothetical protein